MTSWYPTLWCYITFAKWCHDVTWTQVFADSFILWITVYFYFLKFLLFRCRNSDSVSTCDTDRTELSAAQEADGDDVPSLCEREARQLEPVRLRQLHSLRRTPRVAGKAFSSFLSIESRFCDPPREKLLRWQHYFTVPKSILDGSTLAMWLPFPAKLMSLSVDWQYSEHCNFFKGFKQIIFGKTLKPSTTTYWL